MDPVFGIDLGGTKIEGVVLPYKGSIKPIVRLRLPTEGQKGYAHIVNQLASLVQQLEYSSQIKAEKIGICTPGTVDPKTGLHKNSNTTALNGQSFRSDVEVKLGIPVKMANDANCFALAESTLGAVKQKLPADSVVFGIIMGTGVGGGLVVNGNVLNGAHGIAGEWGHNFLDASGGPCYCGKIGCVEKVISGPALENFYLEKTGKVLNLKEILAAYGAGNDTVAKVTIERLIHFFGLAVSNLVNILDPHAIVIGGGVGNVDLLYTKGVEEVKKYIFNPELNTIFLKPALGDSAGVFGAAML